MKFLNLICSFVVLCCIYCCSDGTDEFSDAVRTQLPGSVDFNFHVKPILSDKCFPCHGPDVNKLQAGLRLDIPEMAYANLESGRKAIVPGKVKQSELYHRVLSEDTEVRMPPAEFKLFLTEYEKAVLIRWIDQGAEYKPHWSFMPPTLPALPPVNKQDWVRNPIDQFVLARLEREGLTPSKPCRQNYLNKALVI